MGIDDLIAAAINVLFNIGDTIKNAIGNSIGSVTGFVSNLATQIRNYLGDVINYMINSVTATFNNIVNKLQTMIQPVVDFVGNLATRLGGLLDTLVQKVASIFDSVFGDILNTILDTISQVEQFVADIGNNIRAFFSEIIDTIHGWFDTIVGQIRTAFETALNYLRGLYETIVGGITNSLAYIAGLAGQALQQVTTVVNAAWGRLVDGAESIIASINDRIEKLDDAFKAAADKLSDKLGELRDKEITPIREALTDYFKAFAEVLDPDSLSKLTANVEYLVEPHSLDLGSRVDLAALIDKLSPPNPLSRAIFTLAFLITVANGAMAGVTQANAARVMQEYAIAHPYRVMNPDEATAAYFRANKPLDEAKHAIRASGLDDSDSDQMLESAKSAPDPGMLIAMKRRKLIDENTYQVGLKANAIKDAFHEPLFGLSNVIPPVGDLITMVVKEAFDDTFAQEWGADNEQPAAAAPYLEMQGLSADWIKRYWRMHWNLPSLTQGYEMYQRGEIKLEQLQRLMKAQDVLPGWRDHLIAIAYNTLTRVDIRRLFQLGLLKEDGLVKEYQRAGYSPEHAEMLTALTVKMAAASRKPADPQLGQMTRATVIKFFVDGLINEERAVSLLVNLGVTPEAAALYVADAELNKQHGERRAGADFIVAQVEAGEMAPEAAEVALRSLGLSQTEIETYMTRILRKLTVPTKRPSREDADKFLKAGFVSDDEYIALVKGAGYAERYARMFLALARGK